MSEAVEGQQRAPLLSLRGINKSFGAVQVGQRDRVDRDGEIGHGLALGWNCVHDPLLSPHAAACRR